MKKEFKFNENGVDFTRVPQRKLRTGDTIPAVGIGTFGSDRFTAEQISDAVLGAIGSGYRHIDCASVYMNEKEIGNSLKLAVDGGVPREELWITSKVWNDMHDEGDVIKSCKQSIEDLQVGYLDLYLVHWPFPNYHAPGCDVDSRSPDSKPFSIEDFMVTWRQMERLVEMGLVKNIGTSNMTVAKFDAVWDLMAIKPSINEMEIHPHFQQKSLFEYCTKQNIQQIGFCPIGSPTRPDRDKSSTDTSDIEDPVILKIAKRLNVHPAVVCVKWATQRGQIPIPFSIRENEYISNLACSMDNLLTEEEMDEISGIDKDCRLIKGQVFLWESAKSWEDLWDLEGEIVK